MGTESLPLTGRVKAVIDAPIGWRPRVAAAVPPFRIYGVYRSANAQLLAQLVRRRPTETVHLWALDQPHEALADRTYGHGPGGRFDLIDELFHLTRPARNEYVVLIEDDIALVRGNLDHLVRLSHAARLDLAQPGHDRRGFVNYGLTVSRPVTRARRTTFVEIGPILVINPDRVADVLPACGVGMGYGLERYWYNLHPSPRMGVIDEVRVRHLRPTGRGYDQSQALADMHDLWSHRRVLREQPQETLQSWPAWRSLPPWVHADRVYGD